MKELIITNILAYISIISVLFYILNDETKVIVVEREIHTVDTIYFDSVNSTYYNPEISQCNDNPLVTASGKYIDTTLLKCGQIRWVALSRDLLNKYHYGDTIMVISNDTAKCGKWIVHDTMNKRFKGYVDFLQPCGTKFQNEKIIIYKQ